MMWLWVTPQRGKLCLQQRQVPRLKQHLEQALRPQAMLKLIRLSLQRLEVRNLGGSDKGFHSSKNPQRTSSAISCGLASPRQGCSVRKKHFSKLYVPWMNHGQEKLQRRYSETKI